MTTLRALRTIAASAATAGTLVGGTQLVIATVAEAGSTPMTTTANVNVRTAPSTSSQVLTVLPTGTVVAARGKSSNGWTPVTYQGRQAWINSAYLGAARRTAAPAVKVSSSSTSVAHATTTVNVRTGPSTDYPKVTMLNPGDAIRVTGRVSGQWTQAVLSGNTVWIYSQYLTLGPTTSSSSLPRTTKRARATVDLMIRTDSSDNFTNLGDVPAGTILDLTGKVENGVAQVVYQGAVRWVNANFLQTVGSSDTVPVTAAPKTKGSLYAKVALNLWTASSGSDYVGEVPAGTKLAITGTVTGTRAQVVYQGTSRWVTAMYLTASKPSATTPVGLVGGTLNTGGSVGLDGLTSNAKGIVYAVRQNFPQITTLYGVRPDPLPDHPSGHAVDIMLPNYRSNYALGLQIAQWMQAHASELNIQYIIYHQHIWSVARSSEGWRLMADRGGDTANHFDHVHVTVN